MIERKFMSDKIREFQVQEYVALTLEKSGHSRIEIKRTPLGEKIIVYTTRPGLIVGRKGENVKRLTAVLKKRFNMENPQIEIGEIENPMLDVWAVADQIANSFERFGTKRFKFVGYNTLTKILGAGALGAEIVISGKVPGARAKSWRFSAGYLKKSGDISENFMQRAKVTSKMKTGIVGIKVSILPPTVVLPDRVTIKKEEKKQEIKVEELKEIPKELKELKEELKKVEKEEVKEEPEEKKPVKKEKSANEKPAKEKPAKKKGKE